MGWASIGFGWRGAAARAETRDGERQAMRLTVTARLAAGDPVSIVIEDLSVSGFRASIPLALQKGTLLRIGLPGGRSPHARVVRTEDGRVGCAFLAPLDPAVVRMLTEPSGAHRHLSEPD